MFFNILMWFLAIVGALVIFWGIIFIILSFLNWIDDIDQRLSLLETKTQFLEEDLKKLTVKKGTL